jgi:hypothetical protein
LRARASQKRGVVLVAVLVIFSVNLTLFGLWSRAVIRERSSMITEQFRLQARQLAEAGLQRAVARRAADANYMDEVWSVPAAELDTTHAAQVQLRVTSTSDPSRLRYEAVAEFPVGAVRRVRITKSVELLQPTPPNKS